MDSLVVYYSETGNTEKIAEAIAEGLGSSARMVDDEDADFVVIGTPVHGGRPAGQIMDFINKTSAKKAAVFCTCAGRPRDTLETVVNELKRRGIDVIGQLEIKLGRDPPTKEHLRQAKEFGRSLA